MEKQGKACPVCLHVKRNEIDLALIRGASSRKLATQYGMNNVTVWRHMKRHLPKSTPPAAGAAGGSTGDDLLAEVGAIAAQQQRILDRAEESQDYRAAISAGRELLRCVELSAKLRGELATGPTINIVASPGFQQIVALMLEYADPFRRVEMAERLALMAPTREAEPLGVIEHVAEQ